MNSSALDTTSQFMIRKATIADAEAIATININSWKSTYQNVIKREFLDSLEIGPRIPGAVKRIQREELDCFVAVDSFSNKVIGFADFGPCRDQSVNADAELYAIYLEDKFKGHGIGRKLFQQGHHSTKKRAYKQMMVSVFEKNDIA